MVGLVAPTPDEVARLVEKWAFWFARKMVENGTCIGHSFDSRYQMPGGFLRWEHLKVVKREAFEPGGQTEAKLLECTELIDC
jgi:hypothetical protein